MDLKERYITEAAEQGRCTESADSERADAAYDQMMASLAELRRLADRGESMLIEMLSHPNRWVRLSAATHLLPLRADLASKILDDLAFGPRGELRFEAEMVLREWRAGRLKVP